MGRSDAARLPWGDPVTTTQYRVLRNCNLRQEPDGRSAIAAVVQAGQIVHVDKTRAEGGWQRVQVVNGWISGELLEEIDDDA